MEHFLQREDEKEGGLSCCTSSDVVLPRAVQKRPLCVPEEFPHSSSSPPSQAKRHRSTNIIPGDINVTMTTSLSPPPPSLSLSPPAVFLHVSPYPFTLSFFVRLRWNTLRLLHVVSRLYKLFVFKGKPTLYGEAPSEYPVSREFEVKRIDVNGKIVFDSEKIIADVGSCGDDFVEKIDFDKYNIPLYTGDKVTVQYIRVEPIAIVHIDDVPNDGREIINMSTTPSPSAEVPLSSLPPPFFTSLVLHYSPPLLIICKPPAFPVHPCGLSFHLTIMGLLYNGLFGNELRGHHFQSLHRLDKPTTGILFAVNIDDERNGELNSQSHPRDVPSPIHYGKVRQYKKNKPPPPCSLSLSVTRAFHQLLRTNQMKKLYLCIVKNEFPCGEVVQNEENLKKRWSSSEFVASTSFFRIAFDGERKLSLLAVRPLQGRFHQIRRHLKSLGYPIHDDVLYNEELMEKEKKPLGLDETENESKDEESDVEGEEKEEREDSIYVLERHSAISLHCWRVWFPYEVEVPPILMDRLPNRMISSPLPHWASSFPGVASGEHIWRTIPEGMKMGERKSRNDVVAPDEGEI